MVPGEAAWWPGWPFGGLGGRLFAFERGRADQGRRPKRGVIRTISAPGPLGVPGWLVEGHEAVLRCLGRFSGGLGGHVVIWVAVPPCYPRWGALRTQGRQPRARRAKRTKEASGRTPNYVRRAALPLSRRARACSSPRVHRGSRAPERGAPQPTSGTTAGASARGRAALERAHGPNRTEFGNSSEKNTRYRIWRN